GKSTGGKGATGTPARTFGEAQARIAREMSTATCARFCTPLTSGPAGSTSKLTTGNGSGSTMTSSYKKKIPSNSSSTTTANDSSSNNTETTFTFKLGRSNGRSSSNVASSESSDPLESDYSEEDPEQEQQGPDPATNSRSSSTTTTTSSADHDNDVDEEDEEDDEDEEVGNGRDADDATHDSSESIEEDDGNETDDEEDDDESEESSSVQTAKGVRKYHLDDYQIIKTVGKSDAVYASPTGRMIDVKVPRLPTFNLSRIVWIIHYLDSIDFRLFVSFPGKLEWSTKDDSNLYMIFDYVCGGELFTYLRNAGKFTSQTSNFYAAEIVSALEYLHSLQIVYRDLKPENLLINRDGHLKITDFGFAKKLRDRTWTLCGTPEYIAPEIIQSKGHNKAVDWWALGVLIYEMLVGYPPFYDEQPFGIYEKILSGKIEWERHMDPIAKDLIKKLLVNDRTKRLGNMKRHRWFKHLNWNDVYSKKLKPPILPDVHHDGDTKNFDDYPEKDWKPAKAVDQRDLQYFNDF
ncbi:hypothetical protein KR084_007058, partial [Drosophila pseudotakahashii]